MQRVGAATAGVQPLQADSAVPLQRADWGRATQARLLLHGSKTDQRQCGKTLVLAAPGGSAVDPIGVLRALLQALPAGVDGTSPLMALFRGQQQSVLTRAELAAVVQQMVSDAGRDIDNIGTHAMRVGGATTLAAAGMSGRAIKLAGRWRSDADLVYIRDNREEFDAITAALAQQRCLGTDTVAW